MAYDVTTTPSVGDATKRSDYTRLRDAIKSVRQQDWDLGGSLNVYDIAVAADTWVDVPDSWQKEINGDDLSGLGARFEVNGRGDSATNVTITLRLFNVTAGAAVASSEVTLTNPGATPTRGVSSTVTLAAGDNVYKPQFKRSVNTVGIAARARVYTR